MICEVCGLRIPVRYAVGRDVTRFEPKTVWHRPLVLSSLLFSEYLELLADHPEENLACYNIFTCGQPRCMEIGHQGGVPGRIYTVFAQARRHDADL